ncbi:hypothetical protein K502DRAFT_350407 [Neoconidiobolus thromboides FSU 785]|nr:hypothetical protein K502DRAFT_350407 [Neoconidiobolus thromboides FSU 785]
MNLEEVVCSKSYSGLPAYSEGIGQDPEFNVSNGLRLLPADLEVRISQSGIVSHDKRLNKDAVLLKSYIYTYNSKPELKVRIKGVHKETYEVTETYYKNNKRKERQVMKTRDVVDFDKEIDLTSFISQKGKIHNPYKCENSQQELMQEIKNYIKSEATLKELKIVKEVIWDYDLLTQKIKKALRIEGYYHTISVKYILSRNEIIVRQGNWINALINSPLFTPLSIVSLVFMALFPLSIARCDNWAYIFNNEPLYAVFNVISCLFLVAWPLSAIFKKRYCSNLKSSFTMDISPNAWFWQNRDNIKSMIYEDHCQCLLS